MSSLISDAFIERISFISNCISFNTEVCGLNFPFIMPNLIKSLYPNRLNLRNSFVKKAMTAKAKQNQASAKIIFFFICFPHFYN